MNDLWFVSLDTVRLRQTLLGARAQVAARALSAAARAARVRLIHARVLPFGVRIIIGAISPLAVRGFTRALVARANFPGAARQVWRASFYSTRLRSADVDRCRHYIDRCAAAYQGDQLLSTAVAGPKKPHSRRSARALVAVVRVIESSNDALLGTDEVAARSRRYVADHDAPADDASAFARLCLVVFAQGLGFAVVDRHRADFAAAFDGFVPAEVARFDDARVRGLMRAPIIRNEAKIRACIQNARRWLELARDHGTYLARVAAAAADDNANEGWPGLAAMLEADFARIGGTASRQTLKRWGFFTAFANPGAHRLLSRLGFIAPEAAPADVQRVIGGAAGASSRDPYALEASLALFAGAGPCVAKPRCHECALLERCPAGAAFMAPDQPTP